MSEKMSIDAQEKQPEEIAFYIMRDPESNEVYHVSPSEIDDYLAAKNKSEWVDRQRDLRVKQALALLSNAASAAEQEEN